MLLSQFIKWVPFRGNAPHHHYFHPIPSHAMKHTVCRDLEQNLYHSAIRFSYLPCLPDTPNTKIEHRIFFIQTIGKCFTWFQAGTFRGRQCVNYCQSVYETYKLALIFDCCCCVGADWYELVQYAAKRQYCSHFLPSNCFADRKGSKRHSSLVFA